MVQLLRLQSIYMVDRISPWHLVHPPRPRRDDWISDDPIAHRSIHAFSPRLLHQHDRSHLHGHISLVLPVHRRWSWMVVRLHPFFYSAIFHFTNYLLEKISRPTCSPHQHRNVLRHAAGLPEFYCDISTWCIQRSYD